MRSCAGPLLCAIGLLAAPACGDDLATDDGACEPLSFAIDALTLKWQWTADDVTSIPLVADVDDDGVPDIVLNIALADSSDSESGELALLDSVTGKVKWRIRHNPGNQRFGSHGRATVVVSDVDGDRVPDIVYAGRPDLQTSTSPIHAVNGAGELLWTSHHPSGQTARITVQYGAPAVANLDTDPAAEIAFGAAILDNDGLLVWNQDNDGGVIGTPTDNQVPPKVIYPGGLPTFVDLDDDGEPELLTGRDAWKIAWTPGAPPSVSLSRLWQNLGGKGNDGWPAVADLDGNGSPEVVLTAWPDIRVLDGRSGELWCGVDPSGKACAADPSLRTQPIAIKGANLGGPATLADFDGDGRLEAAIAGGTAIAVYDFNRPDEQLVLDALDPQPAPGAMYVRWHIDTQDQSSASTGSLAFDFDADGRPELLYQDECHFRVLDGATGSILGEIENSSLTGHEYPIVADIDADAETEILVIANNSDPNPLAACKAQSPAFTPRQGLFVYGAKHQRWVPARPLWPQYNHHITDVDARGAVPTAESPHWADPATNGFRQALRDPNIAAATCN